MPGDFTTRPTTQSPSANEHSQICLSQDSAQFFYPMSSTFSCPDSIPTPSVFQQSFIAFHEFCLVKSVINNSRETKLTMEMMIFIVHMKGISSCSGAGCIFSDAASPASVAHQMTAVTPIEASAILAASFHDRTSGRPDRLRFGGSPHPAPGIWVQTDVQEFDLRRPAWLASHNLRPYLPGHQALGMCRLLASHAATKGDIINERG